MTTDRRKRPHFLGYQEAVLVCKNKTPRTTTSELSRISRLFPEQPCRVSQLVPSVRYQFRYQFFCRGPVAAKGLGGDPTALLRLAAVTTSPTDPPTGSTGASPVSRSLFCVAPPSRSPHHSILIVAPRGVGFGLRVSVLAWRSPGQGGRPGLPTKGVIAGKQPPNSPYQMGSRQRRSPGRGLAGLSHWGKKRLALF